MGHIHNGHPETSQRLRAALSLLQNRGPVGATTWELHDLEADMAPHSTIAELRQCGFDIQTKYEGRNERRRKVYRYTLIRPAAPVMVPMAPVEVVQMQDGQLCF